MSAIGAVSHLFNAPAVSNRTQGPGPGGSSEESGQKFDPFDFSDTRNALFQTLLKDPGVQERATLNEDSTYSFGNSVNGLTVKQGLARLLIDEQNGSVPRDPGALHYTPNQLSVFKEMTGINLVQAGGLTTFADDDGNQITDPEKLALAREVETTISLLAFNKAALGGSTDIDISEVIDLLLTRRNSDLLGKDILDTILADIGEKNSIKRDG